ncbi:hypothetical protein J6590_049200 [Homalodisca vitripennis]|nr:hypothetical protein J6590_049200 [Homalodisca vitripennis]
MGGTSPLTSFEFCAGKKPVENGLKWHRIVCKDLNVKTKHYETMSSACRNIDLFSQFYSWNLESCSSKETKQKSTARKLTTNSLYRFDIRDTETTKDSVI